MQSLIIRLRRTTGQLWRASAPLTFVGLLMIPVLVAAAFGLWLDPRVITGAPAWLKPAKFAVSIAIYGLTLAWVLSYLPAASKIRHRVGWLSAIALSIEIAIISLQAARGRASHFNVSTPLDQLLFAIMGTAIVVQTVASVAIVVALWKQ